MERHPHASAIAYLRAHQNSKCVPPKVLHHCILLFITFDLICNMTMFVQNGFWTLWGHTPWPCPQGLHQNSECVPPVLIHRAITCDSFKVLDKTKPKWSSVTIKKRTQNPTVWPLVTPSHTPGAIFLHHYILLFITFDFICNMTMFVQKGFWTLQDPCPAPRGYIKIRNEFIQSSSIGLSPVKVSRF